MNTTTLSQSGTPRNRTIFPALLVILLLIVAAATVYGALERTIHADKAHAGQSWTASRIQEYFDTGKCKPNIYTCGDAEIHWCSVDNGRAIGLVIGRTVKQVVTGFMATPEYWQSRCQ